MNDKQQQQQLQQQHHYHPVIMPQQQEREQPRDDSSPSSSSSSSSSSSPSSPSSITTDYMDPFYRYYFGPHTTTTTTTTADDHNKTTTTTKKKQQRQPTRRKVPPPFRGSSPLRGHAPPLLLVLLFLVCIAFPTCAQATSFSLNSDNMMMNEQPQQQRELGETVLPTGSRTIRLALIPKQTDDAFFDPSQTGCVNQAARLTRETGDNVTCMYLGPLNNDPDELQAAMIQDLITQGLVDGLAISARHLPTITPVINYAMEHGIPVVTFDSDAPQSKRITYISTQQKFMGEQIGKVLKQLKPEGGTYATLAPLKEPNLDQRLEGLHSELMLPDENGNIRWRQLPGSPADNDSNMTLTMEIMQAFADQNPTAIAPVVGHPLRSGHWEEYVDRNRDKNITHVAGDAGDVELKLLDQSYIEGLVGQSVYAMGSICARTLYDVIVHNATDSIPSFIGTNVVHHLQVPLILPHLDVNNNLLDTLRYVGFTLFSLITASAIGFMVWLYRNRNVHVVKVSQPIFLIMIIVGIVVMASTLIPLSFDDDGHPEQLSHREKVALCMSSPWLASTGFTITFSALYAKTRRVNLVFRSHVPSRVFVSTRDVLLPFFMLMTANAIVLTLWTAIDPLIFIRQNLPGTDGWKRVIATYGSCRSTHSTSAFLIPLSLINLSVLIMANWQAYEARSIESEFAESKYIALAMASLLQTLVCGVPVMLVVEDAPRTSYLIKVMMLFVICSSVLLFIFIPKVKLAYQLRHCTNEEQRRLILSGGIVRKKNIVNLQQDQQQQYYQYQLQQYQQDQQNQNQLQHKQRHGSSSSYDDFPSFALESHHLSAEASVPVLGHRDHNNNGSGNGGGSGAFRRSHHRDQAPTSLTASIPTCIEEVASENEKEVSVAAVTSEIEVVVVVPHGNEKPENFNELISNLPLPPPPPEAPMDHHHGSSSLSDDNDDDDDHYRHHHSQDVNAPPANVQP